MKREPIKISEMDVQPISDEDLRDLVRGGAGTSDTNYECYEGSNIRICCDNTDS